MFSGLRLQIGKNIYFGLVAVAVVSVSCSRPIVVSGAIKANVNSEHTESGAQGADNVQSNTEKTIETDDAETSGAWSAWIDSGTCDAATGTKRQTRQCEDSGDLASGTAANCIGENSRVTTCPVNGGWSLWVEEKTCTNGTTSRTRVCNNPTPKNGGAVCVGAAKESWPCGTPTPTATPNPTTATGAWSSWMNVGLCNQTTGLRQQTRTCKAMPGTPAGADFSCTGPSTQSAPCIGVIDGGFGDWQPTGPCVEGVQQVIRHCDNPVPQNGGAACTATPFGELRCSSAVPLGETVLVLVDSALAPAIAPELTQYMADLGPKARRIDINLATETNIGLKQRIYAQNLETKLIGVVAVGDLPSASFLNSCDLDNKPATFKTDLFFTDINRTWSDANNDGVFESTGRKLYQGASSTSTSSYSSCSGSGTSAGTGYHFPTEDPLKPSFWMSRIVFWGKDGNNTSKVNFYKQYFAKNHAFRTGIIANPRRGLNYVLPMWGTSNSFSKLYSSSELTGFYDLGITGPLWISEITTNNYEVAMVWVASTSSRHSFRPNDYVYASGIYGQPLKPLFYNLYADSAGNFASQYNTMSIAYLASGNTLGVTASSKIGSTKAFYMFGKIKIGFSLGESLNADLLFMNNVDFHTAGGTILFGDGSIILRQ